MPTLPHIFDLAPDSLAERFQSAGLPRYRAGQVLQWVYKHGVIDLARMSNIGPDQCRSIETLVRFSTGRVLEHQSASDGVQKLLIQWEDEGAPDQPPDPARSRQTESVLIPTSNRKTACISSQIGCPVGCRFCASGLGGLDGNLSAGRIVEQVWLLGQLPEVGRISHVVFMGMGEPLANFGPVVQAVKTLMADWGGGISGRRITISTVGLPAQIRRLADTKLPVTLAISLHAPNDRIRRDLIPWAQNVSIQELIEAGQYFFDQTGREVTLEYTLLRNVNDRPEHARELAGIARKLRSNINLIRYNEVNTLPFDRPLDQDVLTFQTVLRNESINTHIRASRGRDIAAACGQLRHETAEPH